MTESYVHAHAVVDARMRELARRDGVDPQSDRPTGPILALAARRRSTHRRNFAFASFPGAVGLSLVVP